MLKDNEDIYDEDIAPLMTEIIRICKEADMPVFATFEYKPESYCTTAVPVEGDSGMVDRLRKVARPPQAPPMTITTRNAGGQVTNITTVV